jgi:CRISPR system Cascade subunit CasA
LTRYLTKNYGLNYKGPWSHPLSPYYTLKEERLPLHPQPGGLGYRHWLGWVLGMKNDKKEQHAAAIVTHALQHRDREIGGALRLWAFGYDMDNMKPRCWYESTLPLYGMADLPPAIRKLLAKALETEVAHWLNAAELVIFMLRSAVKDAWFSADARGDFSNIDAAFWSATEAPFYQHLKTLIANVGSGEFPDTQMTRKQWHDTLKKTALNLFDQVFVGSGPVERQNPQRVAQAWRQLMRNLLGPKLLAAAGLPVPVSDKPKKPVKAGKTANSSLKESA